MNMTYNTIKKFMFDPTKIIENEWFFFTKFNWVTKLLSGVQNPSIKLTAIQVEQAIHVLIFLLIKHFNCSLVDFSVFRQFQYNSNNSNRWFTQWILLNEPNKRIASWCLVQKLMLEFQSNLNWNDYVFSHSIHHT